MSLNNSFRKGGVSHVFQRPDPQEQMLLSSKTLEKLEEQIYFHEQISSEPPVVPCPAPESSFPSGPYEISIKGSFSGTSDGIMELSALRYL